MREQFCASRCETMIILSDSDCRMLKELPCKCDYSGKASPAGCNKLSLTLPITADPSVWDLIRPLHILRPTETNKLESCVSGHDSREHTGQK